MKFMLLHLWNSHLFKYNANGQLKTRVIELTMSLTGGKDEAEIAEQIMRQEKLCE
jgi:hypothetical protein